MPKGRPAKPLTDTEKAAKQAAKAEAFVKLAQNRVGVALQRIRMIGPLSNKNTYNFEAHQVQQMYDALSKQLNETFSRFQPQSEGSAQSAFSFSSPSENDTVSETQAAAE